MLECQSPRQTDGRIEVSLNALTAGHNRAVCVCWKRHRKLPSVNLSGGRHLGADGLIFGLSEHALGQKMIEHAAEFDVESLDQVQVVTPYDGGVLVRRLPTYSTRVQVSVGPPIQYRLCVLVYQCVQGSAPS